MKILLLNQCFYPDVVSTAQYLSDLAVELAAKDHQVTVICSNRGYDDPTIRFPRREIWNEIKIIRIPTLRLSKSARWKRALSFGSFLATCCVRLLQSGRYDVVVALTSPPLISLLGSWFARLRGGRFLFWVMDLNPDEAIIAGWLRERSSVAKVLGQCLRSSLRHADRIIALDRFMKQRVVEKGIAAEKIVVLPPWSNDDKIRNDEPGREQFRAKHDLTDKFVIMYSGNHSPCHPLDTLLEAALRLPHRNDLVFCFVGGGTEQVKVRAFSERHHLASVKCLPYQPLDDLSASLSAADLHVVVMGDEFRGIVHPSKIYNVLSVGKPVIYIGPEPSHITEIARIGNGLPLVRASHGDVNSVVQSILTFRRQWPDVQIPAELAVEFSRAVVLPQIIRVIEGGTEVSSTSMDVVKDPITA